LAESPDMAKLEWLINRYCARYNLCLVPMDPIEDEPTVAEVDACIAALEREAEEQPPGEPEGP
jgi:hypothetical protein